MTTLQRWVLRHHPDHEIKPDDLELVDEPIGAVAEGEMLMRTVYLSIDPTNRLWMSGQDQYMRPVEIGETMRGVTLGVVEMSRLDGFSPGDIVSGLNGWTTHAIVDGSMTRRIDPIPGIPLTALMSVLGSTGITAWIGMTDIGAVRAGETVVVTAAAGAVGSIAAQIARLRGARVIGIAGGPEKCAWLIDELGLDGAIDYRNEDVGATLDRLCPDGIDLDFENVGGPIMDAIAARMRDFGRMTMCGMISGYNNEGRFAGISDFGRILMHRLTVRGYIVSDHLSRFPDAMTELVPWVMSGQIKWQVHVDQGLEGALHSLSRLFTGDHRGKLLVQVSPEPGQARQ